MHTYRPLIDSDFIQMAYRLRDGLIMYIPSREDIRVIGGIDIAVLTWKHPDYYTFVSHCGKVYSVYKYGDQAHIKLLP